MARATKEVQIIETGDKAFLFTCPMPNNITDLLNDANVDITDLDDEGFEVKINGPYRAGIPEVLHILLYVWRKLYEIGTVETTGIPDIVFKENDSRSTFIGR
jgi:hypothetical protein